MGVVLSGFSDLRYMCQQACRGCHPTDESHQPEVGRSRRVVRTSEVQVENQNPGIASSRLASWVVSTAPNNLGGSN